MMPCSLCERHVRGLSSFMADEGFVHFHHAAVAAHWGDAARWFERLANSMGHEPRRLEGNPQSPVKLVGADALFGRADHVDCDQPVAHLDMAGFEDGPHLDGEGLAAGVAFIQARTVVAQYGQPADYPTMGQTGAPGPKVGLYEGIGGGFIGELGRAEKMDLDMG